MSQITFIIPNRGGEHIDFVISQLRKFYPDEKYIVINQEDNEPFMRGQLFNIAYDYVKTKYMCLIDNDGFFNKYCDLIGIYENSNCQVLQPCDKRIDVKITDDSYETVGEPYKMGYGFVSFLSKEVFKKLNGFSNLFIGYGYEDNDFKDRCSDGKFLQNDDVMCHIQHPSRSDIKHDVHYRLNRYVYRKIPKNERGGLDVTKYTVLYNEEKDGVYYINVKDICTTNNVFYNIIRLHKDEYRRSAYELVYNIIGG